ncbi:hypothetical protein [Methanopyrus kandleri]|uniref:Uncharacterized membrane protein specific for M.kandleri, MK-10 family n=1 Tax=Methanopyrus kandleri (strain AV19 / DSM 6324 / JCM 9639 / NBRC 100938) TaxID=190192 RepID=Q8TVN2_METKA|nr:hypothetical protein [Methanopyrus kandleri]AAM02569.1 Uncharacterized membrane protein specific for M.kandleri, MK-10 family [Methanopyrus kandleri AV19]
MEPLTLVLLVFPGDPGEHLGHALLEHPEILSAVGGGRGGVAGGRGGGGRGGAGVKLSRAGKVLKSPKKFYRVLKRLKRRKHRPERERRRLLLLYWKVRIYDRIVPTALILSGFISFFVVPPVLDFLSDRLLRKAWERKYGRRFRRTREWRHRCDYELSRLCDDVTYRLFLTSLLGFLVVGVEGIFSTWAVEAFADAVLRGEGFRAALDAFRWYGVLGMEYLLAAYAALCVAIAASAVARTWERRRTERLREEVRRRLGRRPEKSDPPSCIPESFRTSVSRVTRALEALLLILPLVTGTWALRWGLWVLS